MTQPRPERLDVLFIGAHPDDESGLLAAFGRWRHECGVKVGVVSITRGEGGGNAVGSEDGPLLGLLREREERSALSLVGVERFFYLDKVDFYYTVSAPLTARVWGHLDTLSRLVRVVRATQPSVIITMNPAPMPGQHGNHQMAGRLAVEAYLAAADPTFAPDQVEVEGLQPWQVSRLLLDSFGGERPTGPDAALVPEQADASTVYALWEGVTDDAGVTWAHHQRQAQRRFISQGWACLGDVPTQPHLIGSTFLSQVASRGPHPQMGTPEASRVDAVLAGAAVRQDGGLPLGTTVDLDLPATATAGQVLDGRLSLSGDLSGVTLETVAPEGWQVEIGEIDEVSPEPAFTTEVRVTIPMNAFEGPARVGLRIRADQGVGYTDTRVVVLPSVSAHQDFLPQVSQYEQWVDSVGMPQLSRLVRPVVTLGSGLTRRLGLVVTNHSDREQSGDLILDLPEGFDVACSRISYGPLPPGEACRVEAELTNTDPTLETGKYGGDYEYTLTVTSQDGQWSTPQWIELVPSTRVPHVPRPPKLDGAFDSEVFTGEPMDISRVWEGDECAAMRDASGKVWMAWCDDYLYVDASVHDPKRGSVLASADCKGHWRTDSLEIDIDPQGTSENTSSTFKAAVIPFTSDVGAWALRDADQRQGPAWQTAPGMRWTARPIPDGSHIQVAIPMSILPSPIDPNHIGVNILYYDTDSDQTAKSRIGWSVWGGVQGDPYRWGVAVLDDHPGQGRDWPVDDPVMPLDALNSADSPQSIEQAMTTGIGLSGLARLDSRRAGEVTSASWVGDTVSVGLHGWVGGVVHVLLVDRRSRTVTSSVATVDEPGQVTLTLSPERRPGSRVRVLAAWITGDGVACSTAPVAPPR